MGCLLQKDSVCSKEFADVNRDFLSWTMSAQLEQMNKHTDELLSGEYTIHKGYIGC